MTSHSVRLYVRGRSKAPLSQEEHHVARVLEERLPAVGKASHRSAIHDAVVSRPTDIHNVCSYNLRGGGGRKARKTLHLTNSTDAHLRRKEDGFGVGAADLKEVEFSRGENREEEKDEEAEEEVEEGGEEEEKMEEKDERRKTRKLRGKEVEHGEDKQNEERGTFYSAPCLQTVLKSGTTGF